MITPEPSSMSEDYAIFNVSDSEYKEAHVKRALFAHEVR